MGGKGGGDAPPVQASPDTSGYATPEQATATLASQAPLDLSGMQQAIDVSKAAAANTAAQGYTPPPSATDNSGSGSGAGNTLASSVLAPPNYWFSPTSQTASPTKSTAMKTTAT